MILVLLLLVFLLLIVAGTLASILLQPSIEAENARALLKAKRRQLVM